MGRRTRGEGSIYKQADGLWAAAIRVDGRPLVKRSKKQEEVRRWLIEMRGKADEGLVAPGGHRQTLCAYLKQWLDTIQPTVRPATYNLYDYLVRLHIDPALGRVQLASLRPDQLQRLYAEKLKAGLSRRTVQLCHVVLHKSLKQAMAWGLIPRNPADAASAPKPQPAEVSIWSAAQAAGFLASVKGERLEALFVVALSTGLRRGELLGLKWEDIDLAQRRLWVRRTVGRVHKAGVLEGSPKSAAGRRQVLLSAPAVGALHRHRARQLQDRLLAGGSWKDLGYVFTSAVGTPVEATTLHRAFVRLTEAAGLPRIRLHDLRHTYATMMLGENVHPKIVQQTLGHAKISLTLDLYSHAIPTMQEQAVQAVERALGVL